MTDHLFDERTAYRQPAKIILWRCKCGHKNKIARCKCGLEVEKVSSGGWRYTNLARQSDRRTRATEQKEITETIVSESQKWTWKS